MADHPWLAHYDPNMTFQMNYPHTAVDQILHSTALKFPHNIAASSENMMPFGMKRQLNITYCQLDKLVDNFAAGLLAAGLAKGERIALYLPNSPTFVVAYYGGLRAGGIIVPINFLHTPLELARQLQDSGAAFIVLPAGALPRLAAVPDQAAVREIILSEASDFRPWFAKWSRFFQKKPVPNQIVQGISARVTPFSLFIGNKETPQPVTVEPGESAVLMYTGGTTGRPKAARLTHANVVANAHQFGRWLLGNKLQEGEEVVLAALPLAHSYGMTACMNQAVLFGHRLALLESARDAERLLKTLVSQQVTIFPGVPLMFSALIRQPALAGGKTRLPSLKLAVSGAAKLDPEVQKTFQELTVCKLVEGYGLSEASPITHCSPIGGPSRSNTIGLPLPDTDGLIVDVETETQSMAAGQAGILCVSGPQVMAEYWRSPEETAAVIHTDASGKRWLHTGDMAMMDEEGFFRIIGRKKEVILGSGGYTIFPQEIEEVISRHPKVLEAAAVGCPADSFDQQVKVCLVIKPDETATAEEVIAYCRQFLAPYKIPTVVEFRRELPKSPAGKVLRRELQEDVHRE